MDTEDQIFRRYKAELDAIGALDRCYYLSPSPTVADRRDYAAGQLQMEETRSRFYAELTACREHGLLSRTVYRNCRTKVTLRNVA